MATLLLRLAAPLQSWGTDSKFEVRRTQREPSKSGVIGILAAALGLSRDADLKSLNSLNFGVRVDREGVLLRDYHTAIAEKSSYITHRYYLADAVFLVGFESSDMAFLSEIENALLHPAFPLFLGRRSCPPTQPFVLGIREKSLEEALKTESWQSKQRKGEVFPENLRILIDCNASDEFSVRLRDLPESFNPKRRKFIFRTAKEEIICIKSKQTTHDAMAELIGER